MGKKDLLLKTYLSNPVRYADVYNGSVFGGAQVRRMRDRSEGEEEQDMWKAVEDLIEDGRTEGRTEGKLEKANQLISIIGNMMERLHCTLEEACEIAGQSVEEYKQARELLSN